MSDTVENAETVEEVEETQTPENSQDPQTQEVVETPQEETQEDTNFLEMSDDDFETQADTLENPEVTEISENTEENDPTDLADENVEDLQQSQTEVENTESEVVDPTDTKTADSNSESDKPDAKPETVEQEPAVKPAVLDPLQVDDATAAAAYREIFAPFNANGKKVQVKTPQEAIRLMQMGAGYTRTMMEIKPQLTTVRTLKNNGIGPDELNYLIELKNGNPDAVKKLVRKTGIDPLDIETGEAGKQADTEYRPKDYTASETQVNFDLALADISSFPEGREILESVRNEWDGVSRKAIFEDPTILRTLADQKTSGIYSQITEQMEHERMLGNLNGVPFLQAYQVIGEAMTTQGLLVSNQNLNQVSPAPGSSSNPAIPQNVTQSTVTPQTMNQDSQNPGNTQAAAEPQVLERKAAVPKKATTQANNTARAKAIAPVKSGVGAATPALPSNPLEMSDEDFEKLQGLEHLV